MKSNRAASAKLRVSAALRKIFSCLISIKSIRLCYYDYLVMIFIFSPYIFFALLVLRLSAQVP